MAKEVVVNVLRRHKETLDSLVRIGFEADDIGYKDVLMEIGEQLEFILANVDDFDEQSLKEYLDSIFIPAFALRNKYVDRETRLHDLDIIKSLVIQQSTVLGQLHGFRKDKVETIEETSKQDEAISDISVPKPMGVDNVLETGLSFLQEALVELEKKEEECGLAFNMRTLAFKKELYGLVDEWRKWAKDKANTAIETVNVDAFAVCTKAVKNVTVLTNLMTKVLSSTDEVTLARHQQILETCLLEMENHYGDVRKAKQVG